MFGGTKTKGLPTMISSLAWKVYIAFLFLEEEKKEYRDLGGLSIHPT